MKQATHHRICIFGNSGSGKSTLANQLSKALHIPVTHLDRLFLHGQFVRYDHQELQKRHTDTVLQDEWIIDGNYRYFMPERLARATLAVFLDVSRIKTVPRVFGRYFRNSQLATSIPEDAVNGISWYLLRWVTKYSRRRWLSDVREMVSAVNPDLKVLVLRDDTVEHWLEQIKQTLSE